MTERQHEADPRARLIAACVILCALAVPLKAQAVDLSARLRLAQSLEQSSEWELAAAAYEELLRLEPSNAIFFDGLRRSYTELKQFDKATALVQNRLRMFPGDGVLLSYLGGLYCSLGDSVRADSAWNAVIAVNPQNIALYRLVASQQVEHRLYDDAIRTFRQAQSATGMSLAFSEDLATLYSAMQEYGEATREYIRQLRANPEQLPFVESRIASFTARTEGVRDALAATRSEVTNDDQNLALRGLLAWLLVEARQYGDALEEYRTIDNLRKANGAEVYSFCETLLREKAYAVAAKGFGEICEARRNPAILPRARFGLARASEELASTDSLQPAGQSPTYRNVVSLYESVARDYPGTDVAVQAWFRVGVIEFDKLSEFQPALDAFHLVRSSSPASPLASEATLATAEIRLAQNDLDGARRENESLLTQPVAAYRDRAMFHIAELDYFQARFDSAVAELRQLSKNLTADLSDDALTLEYFIRENLASAPGALAAYASADLLMRQRKYSEALVRFRDTEQAYAGSLLVDDAAMKEGELQTLLGKPMDALASYRRIVNEMPQSIVKDKAQFRIGMVYETTLHDAPKAIEAYEELLAKYPTSLHAEEARRRVRMLRGDSI